jgi:acetyl-CoA carboxylase biotin carboxylase subunit
MQRALEAFIVVGIETSVSLHQKILSEPDFVAGNLSTKFMERFASGKKPGHGGRKETVEGAGGSE